MLVLLVDMPMLDRKEPLTGLIIRFENPNQNHENSFADFL
jgi:hypothetical protein